MNAQGKCPLVVMDTSVNKSVNMRTFPNFSLHENLPPKLFNYLAFHYIDNYFKRTISDFVLPYDMPYLTLCYPKIWHIWLCYPKIWLNRVLDKKVSLLFHSDITYWMESPPLFDHVLSGLDLHNSLDRSRFTTMSCRYSQTCLIWPSKGKVKFCHIRQVVA